MSKRAILLITFATIVVFFGTFYLSGRKIVLEEQKANKDNIILILDYGDSQRSFQVGGGGDSKAWNLLQQASAVAGFALEPTKDFRPSRIGNKVNGVDNKKWIFYVNGIKQKTSPYEVLISPPAEVAFRFE